MLTAKFQLLLSASEDKRLALHDVRAASKTSGAVTTFSGHSSWVLSTSLSSDGRAALSGYDNKSGSAPSKTDMNAGPPTAQSKYGTLVPGHVSPPSKSKTRYGV